MEQGRALWKSVLVGLAAGAGTIMILCLLMAALVNAQTLPIGAVPLLGIVAALSGILVASLVAARKQGGKTLPTCLLTGAGLIAVLLLAKGAFFQGWSAYTVPGLTVGVGLAILAAFVPGGKRRRIRKR